MRRLCLPLVALVLAWALAGAAGATVTGAVVVVDLSSPIDKVSARFLSRALGQAAHEHARLVVVRIDTPGGLLDATRDMVGDIFSSRVPVVSYVAPAGARAASAGTFIAEAAAAVAMAPATNIGAASVVGTGGQELPKTLGRKATEDATAFMRSIAQRRGRPEAPLVAAVLRAKAYSAEEAVRIGIADLVAPSLPQLLAELDGRTLVAAGGPVTVHTAGAPVHEIRMNLFERLLSFLADPNIAFLLISLGTLALAVELWSPGLWVPGATGVIALVLGFAGVGNLPFSWAAVALLSVAVLLFVLEALHPGVGLFGAFGTVALVLGGVFLLGVFGPPALPGGSPGVSRWIVGGAGALAALAVAVLVREVRLSHRAGYVSPLAQERLVGQIAEATSRLAPHGEVRLAGEAWSAELRGADSAEVGESVRVVEATGLVLVVEPLTET